MDVIDLVFLIFTIKLVKDVEDEYDLVEEAFLMEQNDVEDPIIDDYEINYNQLSEVKQIKA